MMSHLIETEADLDFPSFVNSLFHNESQPPFSFRIELTQSLTEAEVSNILGSMLVTGAQIKYGKQLHELSDVQIGRLRTYLLSIGWDADYNPVSRKKQVIDYEPDGIPYLRYIEVKEWQITFKPADQSLNQYNSHCIPGSAMF